LTIKILGELGTDLQNKLILNTI